MKKWLLLAALCFSIPARTIDRGRLSGQGCEQRGQALGGCCKKFVHEKMPG